jgi:hypothetical protein
MPLLMLWLLSCLAVSSSATADADCRLQLVPDSGVLPYDQCHACVHAPGCVVRACTNGTDAAYTCASATASLDPGCHPYATVASDCSRDAKTWIMVCGGVLIVIGSLVLVCFFQKAVTNPLQCCRYRRARVWEVYQMKEKGGEDPDDLGYRGLHQIHATDPDVPMVWQRPACCPTDFECWSVSLLVVAIALMLGGAATLLLVALHGSHAWDFVWS